MRPGRRHHRLRKLARPGRGQPPPPEEIPLGIPVDPDDPSLPEESTLVEAKPVAAPTPARGPAATRKPSKSGTQDDTVEVLALKGKRADPNGQSEGALDRVLVPDPPERIAFTCACGVRLAATKKSYDKRMRCAKCRTLMLISLVYNPAKRAYGIEPFRVDVPDLPE